MYCQNNQEVYAIESGTVVNILPFTGEIAGYPWWNDTYCVMVESDSGVINYGEILPERSLKIGDEIKRGQFIGNIIRVLKKDKGLPMDMLHLEIYKHGSTETVGWNLNSPKPDSLMDPYELLELELMKEIFDWDGF